MVQKAFMGSRKRSAEKAIPTNKVIELFIQIQINPLQSLKTIAHPFGTFVFLDSVDL